MFSYDYLIILHRQTTDIFSTHRIAGPLTDRPTDFQITDGQQNYYQQKLRAEPEDTDLAKVWNITPIVFQILAVGSNIHVYLASSKLAASPLKLVIESWNPIN